MTFASVILSIVLVLFGFAGGGGSSSGGGGSSSGGSSSYSSSSSNSDGDGEFDPVEFIVFLIIIIAFIIWSNKNAKRLNARRANKNNSTPPEKWIHLEAKRIFESYQADWTALDGAKIATYTTNHYHEHAELMLDLFRKLHRYNKVSKLKVHYVILNQPVNDQTQLPAKLTATFIFGGLDQVIDTSNNKMLYSANVPSAEETWTFIYDGTTLKLDGISQPTESAPHLIRSLAAFADENHLFYSPDWGRYALPSRGLIFGGNSMKISDINNHIIGKWGNNLIQLYTYAETPGNPSSYYLVGQINVPKEYFGVIVESKKYKTTKRPDKSYEKFELEWPDFNNRYNVYAAKRDALPAFELLNPKFMEYLYDKKLNYNIEVVDNVIYIFANVRNATEENYAELLDILNYAYKELER
ncbi:DUF3137 domain-containing protein [Candidatus Saccharibacteria bacterium]|nr:DUF3137 domain-containing protein [Candidatus Saccharibacteria bacterium]